MGHSLLCIASPSVSNHLTTDKVHVPAEPIELGDSNGALELLRGCESGLELRTTVEGIGALAGLNLHELADQLQTFGFSELIEGLPLGLDRRSPSTTLITRRCLLATCGSKPC